MIPEIIWWIIGFLVPGVAFFFLTGKKRMLDSLKYAGVYYVALFGFTILAGWVLKIFAADSLASKIFLVMMLGSFASNFAAAYLIQKIQFLNRFRIKEWYVIPIINVLVGVLGIVTAVQQLNLFSAAWGGM